MVDQQSNKQVIKVATIKFKFQMTDDEAVKVLEGKKNKVSKEYAKYFRELVVAAAKRLVEAKEKNEDVSNETVKFGNEVEDNTPN